MEQEKKLGGKLKELFDMLSDKAKAEAMYSSFTRVLFDEISTKDVRQDLAINIIKYIATMDAAAKVKVTPDTKESEAVTRELTDVFEIECKMYADEIMKLPAIFREKMAEKPKPEDNGLDLVAIIMGSCNCENCLANRRAARAEEDGPSGREAPTEPPPAPPPEPPMAGEAPLG